MSKDLKGLVKSVNVGSVPQTDGAAKAEALWWENVLNIRGKARRKKKKKQEEKQVWLKQNEQGGKWER